MITAANLKSRSSKDLAALAKKKGVSGWQAMKKDELVKAIVKAEGSRSTPSKPVPAAASKKKASAKPAAKIASAKSTATKSSPAKAAVGTVKVPSKAAVKPSRTVAAAPKTPVPPTKKVAKVAPKAMPVAKPAAAKTTALKAAKSASKPIAPSSPKPPAAPVAPVSTTSKRVIRKIQEAHEIRGRRRDVATESREPGNKIAKDRCALLVRDPYWLQAYWEISRETVERAKVALAAHWHTAHPVLRLSEIDDVSTTTTAERVVREIPVHGGVCNWYIDVVDPPKTYRVALGYRTGNGKFHVLARSNKVSTPPPGAADLVDGNWSDIAENCEKIFALSGGYQPDNSDQQLRELFEDRLRRPMGSPASTQYGAGADMGIGRLRSFEFMVDAEMIVFGQTDATAYVTLGGEPVKLRTDGSFAVRLPLPDRRQVLPIVASSADGVEQRTTVLAVERNTKVMEPLIRESGED